MIRGTAPLEQQEDAPQQDDSQEPNKPPAVVETGRIKAPPVCQDAEMIQTSMTTETLQQWVFDEKMVVPQPPSRLEPVAKPPSSVTTHTTPNNNDHTATAAATLSSTTNEPVSVVSVTSSNNSCGEVAHYFSSDEATTNTSSSSSCIPSTHSTLINTRIAQRKISRNGRATQRWSQNNSTRLVVGCVPILKDSRILFVSASRKAEWILPKGGWEQDESMEESALRECFEESGCLGSLGPSLSTLQYETRKAKKRRLEQQHQQQSPKQEQPGSSPVTTPKSVQTSDESVSSSSYSYVQMTLFPLYVQKIEKDWPEKGRLRKAVDIDTAISIMSSRPEFRQALIEVKERNLHLIKK